MRRCSIEITPTELHDKLVSVHYEASLLSGVGSWVGGWGGGQLMCINDIKQTPQSCIQIFSSLLHSFLLLTVVCCCSGHLFIMLLYLS